MDGFFLYNVFFSDECEWISFWQCMFRWIYENPKENSTFFMFMQFLTICDTSLAITHMLSWIFWIYFLTETKIELFKCNNWLPEDNALQNSNLRSSPNLNVCKAFLVCISMDPFLLSIQISANAWYHAGLFLLMPSKYWAAY